MTHEELISGLCIEPFLEQSINRARKAIQRAFNFTCHRKGAGE